MADLEELLRGRGLAPGAAGGARDRQDVARRGGCCPRRRAWRTGAVRSLLGVRWGAAVLALGAVPAPARRADRAASLLAAAARRRRGRRRAHRAGAAGAGPERATAVRGRSRGHALPSLRGRRHAAPRRRLARDRSWSCSRISTPRTRPSLLLLRYLTDSLADTPAARDRDATRAAIRPATRGLAATVAELARSEAVSRRATRRARARRGRAARPRRGRDRGAGLRSSPRSTTARKATRSSSPSWPGCSPRRGGSTQSRRECARSSRSASGYCRRIAGTCSCSPPSSAATSRATCSRAPATSAPERTLELLGEAIEAKALAPLPGAPGQLPVRTRAGPRGALRRAVAGAAHAAPPCGGRGARGDPRGRARAPRRRVGPPLLPRRAGRLRLRRALVCGAGGRARNGRARIRGGGAPAQDRREGTRARCPTPMRPRAARCCSGSPRRRRAPAT